MKLGHERTKYVEKSELTILGPFFAVLDNFYLFCENFLETRNFVIYTKKRSRNRRDFTVLGGRAWSSSRRSNSPIGHLNGCMRMLWSLIYVMALWCLGCISTNALSILLSVVMIRWEMITFYRSEVKIIMTSKNGVHLYAYIFNPKKFGEDRMRNDRVIVRTRFLTTYRRTHIIIKYPSLSSPRGLFYTR